VKSPAIKFVMICQCILSIYRGIPFFSRIPAKREFPSDFGETHQRDRYWRIGDVLLMRSKDAHRTIYWHLSLFKMPSEAPLLATQTEKPHHYT